MDAMDATPCGSQDQLGQTACSALSQAMALAARHECGAACRVEHLFGNTYRCCSSGAVHVCDANCNHRMWDGRHQTRCILSGRTFAVAQPVPVSKRQAGCASQGEALAGEGSMSKRLRGQLGEASQLTDNAMVA